MKGDAQVIGHLQAQLKNELTAINQYFLHYRMLKHWGFDKLAKKEYSESIGEMKHADWLMDRYDLRARQIGDASGCEVARAPAVQVLHAQVELDPGSSGVHRHVHATPGDPRRRERRVVRRAGDRRAIPRALQVALGEDRLTAHAVSGRWNEQSCRRMTSLACAPSQEASS